MCESFWQSLFARFACTDRVEIAQDESEDEAMLDAAEEDDDFPPKEKKNKRKAKRRVISSDDEDYSEAPAKKSNSRARRMNQGSWKDTSDKDLSAGVSTRRAGEKKKIQEKKRRRREARGAYSGMSLSDFSLQGVCCADDETFAQPL